MAASEMSRRADKTRTLTHLSMRLKRELESELVSGWRVDSEAVWLGSTDF